MAAKVKSIFRVFKKVSKFPKNDYKALDKHLLRVFPSFTYSTVDVSESNEYLIPLNSLQRKELKNADAIVLTDLIETESDYQTEISLINKEKESIDLEIFILKKSITGYELWLNYSENKDQIGQPNREDFFILNFEKHKPVNILINGYIQPRTKNEWERIYIEQVYLIEYLGEHKVKATKDKGFVRVQLPFINAKKINFRRLFY